MRRLTLLLLGLLLMACEIDNQYSSAYCSFVFQANIYPTSALTRAVGGTGGDFCIVKAVMERGVYHLKLTPNQGTYDQTDLDLTMSTAIGNERISYAAMGYKQGLIIGRTYGGVLCAYDLQCPNCDNNYELHWGDKPQELQCDKCRRVYDIYGEYSYVKSGDRGHALTQYRRIIYNQQEGRLTVNN
ncbi:MAG: hypothetical protein IJ588_06435 [Prevotella sp.]|nr:hypothetical protein [Prevotella sp.]